MNDTTDAYRMNPAEDTLIYGDDLKEGMWVLAADPDARVPSGRAEDSTLRRQRFRRVTGLRRQNAYGSDCTVFIGEWVDGYQEKHLNGVAAAWIVKRAPEDPAAAGDAQVIARVCLNGYNEHVRLHGPDGDKAVEGPGGGSFTVMRDGRAYTVTVAPSAGEGQ